MSDFDMSKFELPEIPPFNLNSTYDAITRTQQNTEAAFRALEESKREKEAEELRRHNELVSALKEAGEKGATIIVGNNANGVQIQQNSSGASQNMGDSQGLDYEKAKSVLSEIQGYFDIPQFQDAFGENAENVKAVVTNTLESVEKGEDETLIKKSLRILRDIAVGATGNLVAAGILALLGTLPIG